MKSCSLFFSVLLFFTGCHFLEKPALVKIFSKKKMAEQTESQERQDWTQVKNQKSLSLMERIKRIDSFIGKNKGKEIALKAYLLKAKILRQNKQSKQACLVYHKVVESPFDYTKRWEVYRESAQCYFAEGRLQLAVETLENLIRNPKESIKNKKKVVQLQWSFLKNQKAFIPFKLMSLSHLSFFSSSQAERRFWFNQAKNIIDGLSSSDWVVYANQSGVFNEFQPYLLYKAGQYFLTNKEFKKAEKYLKKSLSASLAPSLKREVKQLLSLIKKTTQVNPYLIGVILPLSGRRQALGEKVLRGLYMGLSLDQDSPWQILVLDSKSHPEVVRTHVNDLFYKYHVVGLIGGLTSETAEVMAEKAEEFALPTVVLSQKKDITQGKKFVFQNAITAEQLLTPLIKEVWDDLKIKRVAVLYPDDSYGKDYSSLFLEIFKKRGGQIVVKEMYKSGEVDFKYSIKKLLHLNIKNREKEFEKLKAGLLKKKASTRSFRLTPENVLPIQKDFSAVFIPDSLASLKKIRAYFKYFGVSDMYFLGTNLWQDMNPNQKDFSFVFVDLKEKTQKRMKQSRFYKKFMASYSQAPGHFEQKAYNTALFFKKALEKNIKTRFELQEKFKNITYFQGAYYPLLISETQVFQYPISVYRVIAHKAQ